MTGTRTTKAERALDLARSRYGLHRDPTGPYLRSGERRYHFAVSARRELRADLKYAWREKYPGEAAPADTALNSVIDDLKRLAQDAEPDPVTDDADPADWAAQHDPNDVPEDGGLSLVTAMAGCPVPDGYQVPRDYQICKDGIWYLAGRWGPCRVSWGWLFPVCLYVDPDGDQWMELVWRDRGRWVSRLVRRAVSKSGRKLVIEIGDAGLPITDSEARECEKWLAAVEAVNHETIPRRPVARQLGWQNDGETFVTGPDTPWRVEPKYPEQAAAVAAHHPHGTLQDWQQAISHAASYPVVQAGIYAGLAPVLLAPLGVDSFTVDVGGKSSRGKTITAAAGLSCWADPSQKGDGMFTWQTTVPAAEKRLNLASGLPVVIDESILVKDPAIVDTVLYMVPKNHGKPRGGGHPSMIPWRTILISTGERPITSFTTNQGASARVLSIQRPPFGTGGESSRAAAEAVRDGIDEHYGTAGPVFADRVRDLISSPGGLARLRSRHAGLTAELRGTTDMSGRRAPLIAVIALAAELAHAWKLTPFELWPPARWLDLFSADDPRDNRAEIALDIIREYIASAQDRMYGTGSAATTPAGGWIGHHAAEGPALLPERVREELQRRSYDYDAVLTGWLEMDVLVLKPSQRVPHLINRRLGGVQTKHLIFKDDVLNREPADA